MQRRLRREGLAGYESLVQATLLALCEQKTEKLVFYDVGAHIGLYVAMVSAIFHRANPTCYAFEPTPVPEQRGRSSYFDNHRSVLSLGYGVAFDDPLPRMSFDGFAQLQLLHPRDHEKRISEGALYDGVVATGGYVFAGGAAATVSF